MQKSRWEHACWMQPVARHPAAKQGPLCVQNPTNLEVAEVAAWMAAKLTVVGLSHLSLRSAVQPHIVAMINCNAW